MTISLSQDNMNALHPTHPHQGVVPSPLPHSLGRLGYATGSGRLRKFWGEKPKPSTILEWVKALFEKEDFEKRFVPGPASQNPDAPVVNGCVIPTAWRKEGRLPVGKLTGFVPSATDDHKNWHAKAVHGCAVPSGRIVLALPKPDIRRKRSGRRVRVAVLDPNWPLGGAEWSAFLMMMRLNPGVIEVYATGYSRQRSPILKLLEENGVQVFDRSTTFGPGLDFDEWTQGGLVEMLSAIQTDTVFVISNILYERLDPLRFNGIRILLRLSNFDKGMFKRMNASAADAVLCCSREQYTAAKRHSLNNAVLIPTGVDTGQFAPADSLHRDTRRKQMGIKSRHVILFVGRLGAPLKRLDLFLDVIKIVAQRRTDTTFLVAGYFGNAHKAAQKNFEKAISSLPVCWKKNLLPTEIQNAYAASDILVSTSDLNEGLSNTVLQALSSGLGVLTTRSSGMEDLIDDGENGWLLDSAAPEVIANKLESVLDLKPEVTSRVRRKARATAETQFNISTTVDRYQNAMLAAFYARKLRVAVVDRRFGIGGAEWLLAQLAHASNHGNIEIRFFTYYTDSPLLTWLQDRGIVVIPASTTISLEEWQQHELNLQLEEWNADILLPCTLSNWPLADCAQLLLGISQNTADQFRVPPHVYDEADYLLCVSEDVKEHLPSEFHYKMSVLHNSIDTSEFAPSPRQRLQQRQSLEFDDDDHVVLWCGRMVEKQKRVDGLMKVVHLLRDRSDIHFLVVGYYGKDDTNKLEWEQFLTAHPQVTWICNAAHGDMPPYYSAADSYLSTSGSPHYNFEGLSLSAVQALAAGLPLILTDSGGQREIVDHGLNGWICETEDWKGLAGTLQDAADMSGEIRAQIVARNLHKARETFEIQSFAPRFEWICAVLRGSMDSASAIRFPEIDRFAQSLDSGEKESLRRHVLNASRKNQALRLIRNNKSSVADRKAYGNSSLTGMVTEDEYLILRCLLPGVSNDCDWKCEKDLGEPWRQVLESTWKEKTTSEPDQYQLVAMVASTIEVPALIQAASTIKAGGYLVLLGECNGVDPLDPFEEWLGERTSVWRTPLQIGRVRAVLRGY